MCTLFEVGERVAIPTEAAAIELVPAAEGTAGEAKPDILLEIAFRIMCQPRSDVAIF
jgi:hypothetical protein